MVYDLPVPGEIHPRDGGDECALRSLNIKCPSSKGRGEGKVQVSKNVYIDAPWSIRWHGVDKMYTNKSQTTSPRFATY
jgi:hypothetical protein